MAALSGDTSQKYVRLRPSLPPRACPGNQIDFFGALSPCISEIGRPLTLQTFAVLCSIGKTAADSAAATMEQLSRRRRRPALSCVECRRRKIKCDRNQPCAHCISAKTQCGYKFYNHESVVRRPPLQPRHGASSGLPSSPSGYAPSPSVESQPAKPGQSISQITNRLPISSVPVTPDTSSGGNRSTLPESLRSNAPRDATVEYSNDIGHAQNLTQSSASGPMRGLSEAARSTLLVQHGLQDSDVILNKTRTLRWSHWVGAAEEVMQDLQFVV